ncbi:MAG: hypothetical protein V3W14_10135, partial [Candidatus Neomarinimicrobiota bacterium]
TPYHILNTNVQLVGSDDPRLSGRGGDNFILSPLYCGACSLDYAKTESYVGGRMNLATALAISGAAVDPNTSVTRSRPLSFIMTLLNIRLGYWIQNPAYSARFFRVAGRSLWYMLRDLFGTGLNEQCRKVHLSDGGHFENLGLYELIRRRCRYIIVSDAGADPDWNFGDLARVTELVRADFGAEIDLDIREFEHDAETGKSQKGFIFGTVEYDDGVTANLLYIKTALIDEKLPADILGYHRLNPKFPDESTADQFFDERQFEAYRELGFILGRKASAKVIEKGWSLWPLTE